MIKDFSVTKQDKPLIKFLQKNGMSAGTMFAVIGSQVVSFFKFDMVNMVIIKNEKQI